jgi:hypothetical protein
MEKTRRGSGAITVRQSSHATRDHLDQSVEWNKKKWRVSAQDGDMRSGGEKNRRGKTEMTTAESYSVTVMMSLLDFDFWDFARARTD